MTPSTPPSNPESVPRRLPAEAPRLATGVALASLAGLVWFAGGASPAAAQVFGLGPSDPALFDTVINLPTDQPSILGSVGNASGAPTPTTQLNVADGGSVGSFFEALSGSEVNIRGGSVGSFFEALSGSEVNIVGGSVGTFDALLGSKVSITGGSVGRSFDAFPGSVVNLTGGSVGGDFDAFAGSDVELFGGEFVLNGAPFNGSTITLGDGDVFTGTLSDGSAFVFSSLAGDILSGVTLTAATPPAPITTPQTVTTDLSGGPSGLRAGQELTLQAGGVLGRNFAVVDATLNVRDGVVGDGLEVVRGTINISGGSGGICFDALSGSVVNLTGGSVGSGFGAFSGSEVNISGGSVGRLFFASSGSVVNISGGSVGDEFLARSGSVVNVSGGSVGDGFDALSGSVVNLLGVEFLLDGLPLDALTRGETLTISDRDVTLSGTLADGSPFGFDLNTIFTPGEDFFSRAATLTVTLVAPDVLLGDFNADGVVDLLDLDILGANFGQTDATPDNGDANGDGSVDLLDLDILGANFGTTNPIAAPEPTTLVLAVSFSALTVGYRRLDS